MRQRNISHTMKLCINLFLCPAVNCSPDKHIHKIILLCTVFTHACGAGKTDYKTQELNSFMKENFHQTSTSS